MLSLAWCWWIMSLKFYIFIRSNLCHHVYLVSLFLLFHVLYLHFINLYNCLSFAYPIWALALIGSPSIWAILLICFFHYFCFILIFLIFVLKIIRLDEETIWKQPRLTCVSSLQTRFLYAILHCNFSHNSYFFFFLLCVCFFFKFSSNKYWLLLNLLVCSQ